MLLVQLAGVFYINDNRTAVLPEISTPARISDGGISIYMKFVILFLFLSQEDLYRNSVEVEVLP